MVIGAAVLYGVGIGIARIVEKVDTVNDVIFGWVLGFWLANVFAHICRDPIFEHVKGIVSCKDEGSKVKVLRNIAILTLCMFVCSLTVYLASILPQNTIRHQLLTEYVNNFA